MSSQGGALTQLIALGNTSSDLSQRKVLQMPQRLKQNTTKICLRKDIFEILLDKALSNCSTRAWLRPARR